MSRDNQNRLKYEREALAEGGAVQHPSAGVVLRPLALAMDRSPVPKGREKCGAPGKPRTERARARAAYRRAPKSERKSSFRAWALWMGVSV